MKDNKLELCLITSPHLSQLDNYLDFLTSAIAGGVSIVQFRSKEINRDTLHTLVRPIHELLKSLHIPLIINDHVLLAAEIDADGVHLGNTDLQPALVRLILGPHKMIGYSIESQADLIYANTQDCIDYVAASAVFPSQTKNCKQIWGLEGLHFIVNQSKHPVVAIGGINITNVRSVMDQGAIGIAVVNAIHGSDPPDLAAKGLIDLIREGKSHA